MPQSEKGRGWKDWKDVLAINVRTRKVHVILQNVWWEQAAARMADEVYTHNGNGRLLFTYEPTGVYETGDSYPKEGF